jgi:hypothetical protein
MNDAEYTLHSAPEASESADYDRRKTTRNGGYGGAGIAGLGEVYTSQYAASAKYKREHLPNYRNNEIRKRNSFFGNDISGIVGLRHPHYTLRERGVGVFIPFQHIGIGQRALDKLKCLLFADHLILLHILNLVSHKFPSKAFACFSAGHLKNPLRLAAGNPLPGEMNLPRRSMRNLGGGILCKGKGMAKAALPNSYPLKNHSYFSSSSVKFPHPSIHYRQ